MEKVKLGEITKIRTGKLDANASDINGKYPFFTCSMEPLKINNYSYDCECILVAGNGDLNVKYYNGKFDAYQRTYIIEVKECKQFKTKYLYYLINNNIENLRKDAIGGVIKYIKLRNLADIKVENLDIIDQEKIINTLDKVQEIIDIRKKQIEQLDELIKSQFVEMFENEKNKKKLYKICSYLSRGKSPNYVENSKIKVINQACIYWNEFKLSKVKYQDEHKISKALDKFIKNEDVLITSTGTGTLGRCNVFQGKENEYIADGHISILRLKNNIINPFYFKYYIMQKKIQKKLYAECVNGSTNQIELSKDKFLNFDIVVPPIDLQNKFAEFVKQVYKQKFELQKSLEEIQKLQESLKYKYFG